jgi:hypothetical protein
MIDVLAPEGLGERTDITTVPPATNPYPARTGGPSRLTTSATLKRCVAAFPWSTVCKVTSRRPAGR